MSSSLFSHLKIIMWLRACAMRVNELVCGYSKSYQTPSLSCRTGCGHTRPLVNVARNDISELGFNHTLISRVPVNYLWLYDRMSLYLFLCYTKGNFWWIVTNGGSYLLMITTTAGLHKLGSLHFPATTFCQSACLCSSVTLCSYLSTLLIQLALSFYMGLGFKAIVTTCRATLEVSHNFRYG